MVSSRLAFLERKNFCNDTLSHHHPGLATPTKVSAYLVRWEVVSSIANETSAAARSMRRSKR